MENTVCHKSYNLLKYIIHTEKGEHKICHSKICHLGVLFLDYDYISAIRRNTTYFAPLWNQEVNLPCEGIFLSTKRVEDILITRERIQDWSRLWKICYFITLYPSSEPLLFCQVFTNNCFFVQKTWKLSVLVMSSNLISLRFTHVWKYVFFC